MSGSFLIEFFTRRVREAARRKRVRLAATWPQAVAQINSWKILDAAEEPGASAVNTHQIEAAFYFVLQGDYRGGYLQSVTMSRREAEKLATGNPPVTVRYNPANPDQVAVLAEDNADLPFAILSG